jgi:nicotinate-nucleotide--dimethylbenzimidazole phosphoribosyltransferase
VTEPLDLGAVAQLIPHPSQDARAAAEERQATLAKPTGALGRLEDLSIWLAGVQDAIPAVPFARPRVLVFAGDHGVTAAGVSAYPAAVTAAMVRTFISGGAAVNVLARLAGATVRVLDLAVDADLDDLPVDVTRWKIRRGSGRIDLEDAVTYDEARAALRAGMAIVDDEVDAGTDLLILGDMGIGNTTPAAVLVAAFTSTDVASVVGRGSGIDDDTWMRKAAAVRDALRRTRPHLEDPVRVLSSAGGADIAAMVGALLQAAVRRTPVLLDGVVSGAAALVAHRIAPAAASWWIAGHRSPEPAHAIALARLGLEPIVDYGMRLGEGTGALLALPVLTAAGATLREMATLEEAGVSPQ